VLTGTEKVSGFAILFKICAASSGGAGRVETNVTMANDLVDGNDVPSLVGAT
jgi:hypothetical protein